MVAEHFQNTIHSMTIPRPRPRLWSEDFRDYPREWSLDARDVVVNFVTRALTTRCRTVLCVPIHTQQSTQEYETLFAGLRRYFELHLMRLTCETRADYICWVSTDEVGSDTDQYYYYVN